MKNALITGATKGMGRAISISFANEGINVAICSRNEKELLKFKEELLDINPEIKVFTQVTDGSKKAELLKFAADAEHELGFIDVIVNSLGMFIPASILNESDEVFEKQVNTNLMPTYELYRYFGKTMIAARKGHFFNICSVASLNPIAQAGAYSVTKYALLGLTKVMRLEMQEHGVKVTAIIPGSTLTDSWKDAVVDKDTMVLPEDIASAIINIYKMSPGANVDEIIIKPAPGQL
ncbi:SDR family oxidoreductase [Mucilaginibacter sabulilitoris]|uniref:SDR family oxidoreductase n=1 Tax=Mucilaginibacter sabulilitoris TaxID=1173583 RepID=A0ABZ0TJL2_9SPHI|nr:SDR family oxidoreductase [Mucilaginibacter sabulilitoris]WPU93345.1 SDR family oxidoreductase [Mucilaginibacter sabulilitoris]